MEIEDALARLGGVATTAQLRRLVGRRVLRRAVLERRVVRVHRGRYALRAVGDARLDAHAVCGVVSHLSAALAWGWAVKWTPDRAWVTVPRRRHRRSFREGRAVLVFADLREDEIVDGLTSPLRTVLDCARRLPFDQALCVADSALRSGLVSSGELVAAAAGLRGPGSAACRTVAAVADGRAANPFESVLRALCLEQPGLLVEPQGRVEARGRVWHPDLVDRRLRLAIEADSWEFHTTREAHLRDCVRYTALTLAGWRVIRFAWEQVMLDADYVRGVLAELAALPAA